MPVAQEAPKRNPIPFGDHILTLVSVTETEQPDFNDSSLMKTRWIWQFKAQRKDPETGERFEYREYTGPNYGHSKARFTFLADMMFPNLTDKEKANINTDDYLNTSYNAKIGPHKTEKGETVPKIKYIEPYRSKKVIAAPVVEEEEELDPDPFAEE